jgi:hypothetical protein
MERITKFYPAFDKRNPEPHKNYGIHGVDLRMILKGELGVVQFVLYTNWQLPHVTEEFLNKPMDRLSIKCFYLPLPADIGYHSPSPMYDGQSICSDSCEYLDGRPCYYDGSGLRAEDVYTVLLESGSDGVWKYLEEDYIDRFGELK